MLHFDNHFTSMVRQIGAPWMPLWRFLASYAIGIFVVCALILTVLDWRNAWTILVPVAVTHVLTIVLQELFRRDRPPLSVASIVMWKRTPSFPSAHSSTAMALAITMSAVMLAWGDVGIALSLLAILFAVSIAISRVMVGVHFLGDIIVGMIFGAVVVLFFGVW